MTTSVLQNLRTQLLRAGFNEHDAGDEHQFALECRNATILIISLVKQNFLIDFLSNDGTQKEFAQSPVLSSFDSILQLTQQAAIHAANSK